MKKIIFLTIGLIISGVSLWFVLDDLYFMRKAQIGTGFAEDSEARRDLYGIAYWDTWVRYTPNGTFKMFETRLKSSYRTELNQKIQFHFDPYHPEDIRDLGYRNTLWRRQVLGILGGLVFILFALAKRSEETEETSNETPQPSFLKTFQKTLEDAGLIKKRKD